MNAAWNSPDRFHHGSNRGSGRLLAAAAAAIASARVAS
jgi:hypothetical protein